VSESSLRRTPLYDAHLEAGARNGALRRWEMPVQYRGIVEETSHSAQPSRTSLDVSHMGEFEVDGAGALDAVQRLTTNDAAGLEVGQLQYSLLCYPDGGIVDDATVYRLGAEHFMITVNASNIDKDWTWVTEGEPAATWRNESATTGLIAVQGPRAEALVNRLADRDVTAIGYFRFARGAVAGVARADLALRLHRRGRVSSCTCRGPETPRVWRALLEGGAADGVAPIGLGARDTLRLEMRYALYGNDIDQTTNPLEAGLGWVVKPAKGAFVGRDAIERVRADGPRRRLGRPRDGRPGDRAPRVFRGEGRPRDRRGHVGVVWSIVDRFDRARLRRDRSRGHRHRARRGDQGPGAPGPRRTHAVHPPHVKR